MALLPPSNFSSPGKDAATDTSRLFSAAKPAETAYAKTEPARPATTPGASSGASGSTLAADIAKRLAERAAERAAAANAAPPPRPVAFASSLAARSAADATPSSSSTSSSDVASRIASMIASSKPAVPVASGITTPSAGLKKLRIADDEFVQLRELIYTLCGIFIADSRKYLVENRLTNRLKELNLKSFGEYYHFLRFDKSRTTEVQQLFDVITTNETSFYRNPPQLKTFQDIVVPAEIEKLKNAGQRKLRIWSAGCSTGEEPYTIAMILSEVLRAQLPAWDIKITANDLSEGVVRAARQGIYNEYALRTTPQDIVQRYFTKTEMSYHVKSDLKRLIQFGQINLSDTGMIKRQVERSHIIFCRNVIIYFDDEMKRQVIESFYDNLLPGGCLLIGHSESLHNLSRAFKPEHQTGTIVYRKQA